MRFRDRALKRTIFLDVQAQMESLGWNGSPAPFGATPFKFIDYQPEIAGETVAPNTCAISLGSPSARQEAELGDGLWTYQIPVFIDVYGTNVLISESFASDVMDIIGQYKNTSYITDFTDINNPVDSTDTWELIDMEGPLITDAAAEAADFKRFWRLCRFIAEIYYTPGN